VSELHTILGAVSAQQLDDVLGAIEQAARAGGRACCYGVGREGLCMKGLAMRLSHAGIKVGGPLLRRALGARELEIHSGGAAWHLWEPLLGCSSPSLSAER
jgi:6-phospho-3-hexuloisomerase